jgi:hypothetical protein
MAQHRLFEEIEAIVLRLRLALGINDFLSPCLIDVLENRMQKVFPGFELIRVLCGRPTAGKGI